MSDAAIVHRSAAQNSKHLEPAVSVVTTVYNGERYFDRAVPSILAQTFSDFEYIIVDDGSTDRTPDYLRDLARRDSRIKLFFPGRLGRVRALNFGIERARARYIAQQDFDDISYSHRLQRQVEFLNEHPDVGVVGSYYYLVDSNRGERYVRMPPLDHTRIVRAMARCIPFAHTITTFRKQAWSGAGGYPPATDIEDLKLWIHMAQLNWKLANVPVVLGEHWVHSESYWHTTFQYRARQRVLASVQRRAIRELKLPVWLHVYPAARSIYWLLPNSIKRALRRSIGRSAEASADPAGS